jgi:hypothetical protein
MSTGIHRKSRIVGIIPTKSAIKPCEKAENTFCVADIAMIIGIYIKLQKRIPCSV